MQMQEARDVQTEVIRLFVKTNGSRVSARCQTGSSPPSPGLTAFLRRRRVPRFPAFNSGRGSAGPVQEGRGKGSIQTQALLSPLMAEGGGNGRHPSRDEWWPFGDLSRFSGPERASLFHGHRDQPCSPRGDRTRGVGGGGVSESVCLYLAEKHMGPFPFWLIWWRERTAGPGPADYSCPSI